MATTVHQERETPSALRATVVAEFRKELDAIRERADAGGADEAELRERLARLGAQVEAFGDRLDALAAQGYVVDVIERTHDGLLQSLTIRLEHSQ